MKKTMTLMSIAILILFLLNDAYALDFSNATTSHYSNESGDAIGSGTTGSYCSPDGCFDLQEKKFSHSAVAVTKASTLTFSPLAYRAVQVEDRITIPFTVSTPGSYEITVPFSVKGKVMSAGFTSGLVGSSWGDSKIVFYLSIYNSSGEIVPGSIGGRDQLCYSEKGLGGLLGPAIASGLVDVFTAGQAGLWKPVIKASAEAAHYLLNGVNSLTPDCEWNTYSSIDAFSTSSYLNPGEYELRISLVSEVQSNTVAAGAGGNYTEAELEVTMGDIISNIFIPTDTPEPPSNFTSTYASSTRVDLTWTDTSDNEAGFNIYAVGDNLLYEPWQVEYLIGTVGQNTTTFTDTNPFQYYVPGSCPYKKYTIYSYNSRGESRIPLQNYWLGVRIPPVGEPLDLRAEVLGHDSMKLTWENASNNAANQYDIRCSETPSDNLMDWFLLETVNITDTEYICTDLTADTRYYFRIYPKLDNTIYSYVYSQTSERTLSPVLTSITITGSSEIMEKTSSQYT